MIKLTINSEDCILTVGFCAKCKEKLEKNTKKAIDEIVENHKKLWKDWKFLGDAEIVADGGIVDAKKAREIEKTNVKKRKKLW